MAIRKDLDDMLNSLKTGAPKAAETKPAQTVTHRKSVYDEMSVDDLLSALTDEKKSAENVKNVYVKRSEKLPDETKKDSLADSRSAVEALMEKKFSNAPEFSAKSDSSEIKAAEIFNEKPKSAVSASKAEEKLQKFERSETKNVKDEAPKERKKRIVITGELPDYEAIRREELEKNRIESEKAEAAAKSVVQKTNELTPVEAITAEAIGSPKITQSEEIPETDAEISAALSEIRQTDGVPEEIVPETAEEKRKGGFLSKRKNKRRKDSEKEQSLNFEEASKDEETVVNEEMSEVPYEVEEPILNDFSENTAEEAYEIKTENKPSAESDPPSVDELLDAAIAEIKNAQASEAAEELSSGIGLSDETEAAESDAVNGLIDDIREDTAAAIAELEKSAEEKAEETEQDSYSAESKSDKNTTLQDEEKPKKKLVLRRILDEDPNDIINERSEKTEADEDIPSEKYKGRFKKRLYMVLGAVFSVFAVIGIITVIVKGVGLVRSFTSGEVKKDGFTEIIYPAVIMDIEAFGDPTELTSNQMITAAIWSIVMSEDRISKYNVSPGTDTIFIPYMDVEARAVEMFGAEHPEFNHCTVGPIESRFVYSDGAYNVKIAPITFTYSPEIKSIVKSGNTYTLTVDYIDELPAWMEKSVAKSVEFKLIEKEDGSYIMDSMKILYVKSSNV
ncbi:MAG TPA: hypothetical protein RWO09_07190 [Ruminococcus sp.]